jgi:hypothetical protein
VIQIAAKYQSASLRAVAGAFKATPLRELETETYTPPLDIYCNEMYARHIQRTYSSKAGKFIQEQCRVIFGKLQRRKRRRALDPIVPVIQEKLDWVRQRAQELGNDSRKAIVQEWSVRWHKHRKRGYKYSIAALDKPCAKKLKLYDNLKKAESSVVFQARTGRIGLGHFLNIANVPGYKLSCQYKRGDETAEHILLYCPIERERREWRRGLSFRDLVSEPKAVAATAKWLIQSQKLGQFSLASKLLYSSSTS